ncbi:UNVERIFIED_ORG: hypothetical protein ABIB52_000644 [Arthrobacter sp. UYCu721]
MATRKIIVLEDDLNGSDADETVSFALDGSSYEVDLNGAHAEELRALMRPYTEAARKAGAGTGPARRSAGARSGEVRAWAKEQGLAVNSRGKINADILARYKAAH